MRVRHIALMGLALLAGGCQSTAMRTSPLASDLHPSAGGDMTAGTVWHTASTGPGEGGRWIVGNDPGRVVYESRLRAPGLQEVTAEQVARMTAPQAAPGGDCRIEMHDGGRRASGGVHRHGCAGSPLADVVAWRRQGADYVFTRRDGGPLRVRIID
ncbi:hypothetical protein [Phreatobacter cathodiphilus]|uniref:Alkaline proteinase inhibitor/ Outer membrane lipoprotein Omp19 domain-containing protein n=1 Tax=Phreatobacter cathodiphilus TaxID=1868589 RepID=A0A2S0NFN6_9HYPH|nr:hypothetical protein [Phreatobacter cathodiphilus]AVO46751.1 hypothetical protein C6569_17695 [Phreatobacter cathodiphilus]